MALDGDIKTTIEATIKNDLRAPKVPKERVPKLKGVRKCDSASDFLYGRRAGYYMGLAEGLMLERHRRQLSQDENDAIFAAIEPYLPSLRRYFAYYKARKKK